MPTVADAQAIYGDARARLDYSVERANDFTRSVDAWRALDPATLAAAIREDRLSWSLLLLCDPEPSFPRWGFMFGDVIHHVRATLDNVLSAIARAEGAPASGLKTVQFPITLTEAEWAKRRWRVKCLPERVQKVVEAVQPKHRIALGEDPRHDALARLAVLANGDKHRLAITTSSTATQMRHEIKVEFEEDVDDFEPTITLGGVLRNGEELVRWDTAPHRIANVAGTSDIDFELTVTDDEGMTDKVGHIIRGHTDYVEKVAITLLDVWGRELPAA